MPRPSLSSRFYHPNNIWRGKLAYLLHGAESSQQFLGYSRNLPNFMETEGSLPHSQEPATCPYPEPDQSSHFVRNKDHLAPLCVAFNVHTKNCKKHRDIKSPSLHTDYNHTLSSTKNSGRSQLHKTR
jgi:hypothetical protein